MVTKVLLLSLLLLNISDLSLCKNEVNEVSFDVKCTACKWAAEVIIKYHSEGKNPQRIFSLLSLLCASLGVEAKQVCSGMIDSVGEQLFAILDMANGTISAVDICGMVRGGSCALKSKRLNGWSLEIPDLDHDPPTHPPVWPEGPKKTQKILHLSDPHIQLDYKVGTSTYCGNIICCSESDGYPDDKSIAAGMYGDYHCDLPREGLDQLLASAKNDHPDISYVVLTGDFPAHDVWRQNRTLNLESARAVAQLVQKYFPDTPVFPAIGNHESFPVNMFPADDEDMIPTRYDPSWLYNAMADIYSIWLPNQEQQKTLKDSGYYTILLRPGLRVISVNTNFCNNFNFWLLLNFNDPHRHLHWVYRQLHKAEFKKEKVFIIGHIAPGTHSCLGKWSLEFNRIVRRFRNTILAQFYGHTHFDEFQIFFMDDPKDGVMKKKAINMAYLAPSETPHDGLNPAYRIYTIDGDHQDSTNLVLDHVTYTVDLDRANLNKNMTMTVEYEAKRDLGLPNLSPTCWHKYVENLASSENDFEQFRRHRYRNGPAIKKGCNKKCRKQMLCDLLTSQAQLPLSHCHDIKKLVDNNHNETSWWSYVWS